MDLFNCLKQINHEIKKLEERYEHNKINFPPQVEKYYESMDENQEMENYLRVMDYKSYIRLTSSKLKEFVKDNCNYNNSLKKELELLKISQRNLLILITNLSNISVKELNIILSLFNYKPLSIKIKDINIFNIINNNLILNPLIDSNLTDFFEFYINEKYAKKYLGKENLSNFDIWERYLVKQFLLYKPKKCVKLKK